MNPLGLRVSARRAAGSRPWRTLSLGLLGVVVLASACAIGKNLDLGGNDAGVTTTWTTSTTTTTSTGGGAGTGGAGGAGGTTTTTTTTSGGVYQHTITIDGTNDFVIGDERFASTSSGYYGYYAWDATYLYVGAQGTDIGGGADAPSKWLLIYIGGTPGTTTGVKYGAGAISIQPTLPFPARYHVQWRTDGGATLASQWSGSTWGFVTFGGNVSRQGTYVELRIPLADIGNPTTLDVHLSMVNEKSGSEWTYSGVPSTSFADGQNPNSYAHYYSFDLSGLGKPTSYAPQ